jgi:lycopene beta-cyclase
MAVRSQFDYIIIGSGMAGLQLALAMVEDPFFKTKTIALIDPDSKTSNDRTWSFWEIEKTNTKWESLIHSTWPKANIYTSNKHIKLDLEPYTYKSIQAIDFYNYSKQKLRKIDNVTFIKAPVTETQDTATGVNVITSSSIYKAHHVFDSRIPKAFFTSKKSINIIQHFKGIVIKTEQPVFDTLTMTMMDYRLKDGAQTTFTYVLPFTANEALVEFTYFTTAKVKEAVYDSYIEAYIKDYLNIENYTILNTEMGAIPMTTFPFSDYNTENITKIGTAGGWVKASTGYAFKHTELKVGTIIENIKRDKHPSSNLFKKKYRFYDKVFLSVLKDENDKGEWLFEQFYNKNDVTSMFRFLDETSSFKEELKIMWSLLSWRFVKAFFKTL